MLQQIAICALVVVMMIAIGLRTDLGEFRVVFKRPLPLVLAVVINVVIVPLVALGGLALFELPEGVVVGVVVCAASPGGATGPLFAVMGRGHIATAVTAMISLALLSVVTAPPTITWALGMSGGVDARHLLLPMMGTLLIFQLLPLCVGMVVRRLKPQLAERLSDPANKIANVLLLIVIVGLLVAKGHVLLEVGAPLVVLSVALVCASLLLGAVTSRDVAERRSYVVVTGVRNISLALLISASYFPQPETDAAILTFGLFTMLIPMGLALTLGRLDAREAT